jgi:hypothetical protein
MHDDRMIPVNVVAKRLGRSTEQVRRYLREGTLVGERFGQQWFVDRDVLEAFETRTRERKSFLQKLRPAGEIRALEDVIGIGDGPGSNLGDGKEEYRKTAWWRR